MLFLQLARRVAVPVSLAVGCLVVGGPIFGQELKVAELAGPAVAFAVDLSTGNLVGVDPATKKVSLYKSDLKPGAGPLSPIATALIGERPACVVYKQTKSGSYFVVGCLDEPTLRLLDPTTLKEVAKIKVTHASVRHLASSPSVDDPYVYYCYGHSIGRMDVVRRTDEGLVIGGSLDCAISAKGNFAYSRGPGYYGWSITESRDPGQKTRFNRIVDEARPQDQFVADPFEQYVASGFALYSAELRANVKFLPFIVSCFFTDKPLIAGLDLSEDIRAAGMGFKRAPEPRNLMLASYNTFQVLGSKKLPGELFPDSNDNNFPARGLSEFDRMDMRVQLFADDKRKRVVAAFGNHAVAVPLADFQFTDEPFLVVEADTSAPIVVGKPGVVRLSTKDARLGVELADKPAGATLTAQGIEWTPSDDQLGTHEVKLRLSFGEIERFKTFTLKVVREGVELPIEADQFAVADDGKTAFVWKYAGSDVARPGKDPDPSGPEGAIIDLVAQKAVVSKALPLSVFAADIDEHAVYVAHRDSKTVAVLDRTTLAEKKKIELKAEVAWLQAVGEKLLIVGTTDGSWLKYSAPDMTLVVEHRTENDVMRLNNSMPLPGAAAAGRLTAVDGGWRMPTTGDVYDASFTAPILISSARGIIPAFPARDFDADREKPSLDDAARYMPSVSENKRYVNAVLVNEREGLCAKLVRFAVFESRDGGQSSIFSQTWGVELFDFNGSKRVDRPLIALSTTTAKTFMDPLQDRYPGGLALVGDRLWVLTRTHLYSRAAGELSLGDKPAFFAPRQSATVFDPAGSTTLTHTLVGGKPPYRFALGSAHPGLQLDAETGAVTVHGPTVAKAAMDRLVAKPGPTGNQGAAWFTKEGLDKYVAEQAAARFEALTGRKPTGVPLSLAIEVEATDATPRTARLRYLVLADLPRGPIDDRLAQFVAEKAKAEAAGQAAAAQPPAGIDAATAEARLRKAEERLSLIQAQLNLLLQHLNAKGVK